MFDASVLFGYNARESLRGVSLQLFPLLYV